MQINFNLCCIVLAGMLTLFSCNQKPEKQKLVLKSGGEFVVQQKGEGVKVQWGNWLKMQVIQYFNDTILRDSRNTGAEYLKYDSVNMSAESLKIFKDVHEGDSLEFKVPADSAFKKHRPSFVKNGGFLITKVKVEKILADDEAYRKEITPADSLHQEDNH